MRAFFFMLLASAAVALTGCASQPATVAIPNLPQAMPVDPPGGSYMLTVNTFAGDALHKMLLLRMGSGGGILTTSFVDMHDFEKTSAFGRVASQQVGSRIGQYGFRVIEARLASTLSMTPRAGEFMLTRETAKLLADTYDAAAVLVGSYSDQGNNIFVSARVVRLSDNVIMAAYEYTLPRDGDVNRLLSGDSGMVGGGAWSRHAVRTPAFSRGVPPEGYASPKAATRRAAPKSATAAPKSGARAAASSTSAPEGCGEAPAVPRHVNPVPKTHEPVTKAMSAAPPPAAPIPAAPAAPPVPDKDMTAPAGVPGGA